MDTIGTKQQNRSQRAAAVLFDDLTETIQDLLERDAGGDHFKKTLFTSEQRLPSLALANVYRGPDVTIDFAGLPDDGPAHTLNMLNRSVRQRDPKFEVKIPFLADCFIEASLNKGSVFRMDGFQE